MHRIYILLINEHILLKQRKSKRNKLVLSRLKSNERLLVWIKLVKINAKIYCIKSLIGFSQRIDYWVKNCFFVFVERIMGLDSSNI